MNVWNGITDRIWQHSFLNDCDSNTIIIFEYIHLDNEVFENLIDQFNNKKYNFFSVEENLICLPKNYKILS